MVRSRPEPGDRAVLKRSASQQRAIDGTGGNAVDIWGPTEVPIRGKDYCAFVGFCCAMPFFFLFRLIFYDLVVDAF